MTELIFPRRLSSFGAGCETDWDGDFMKLRFMLPAALALALGLGACQSTKFDPKAAPNLDTITLIGPADPATYMIDFDGNAENSMAAAGLIGFLIAASVDAANSTDEFDAPFTQALTEKHNLKLGTELRDAIKASLEGSGYKVSTEAVPAAPATPTAATPTAATPAAAATGSGQATASSAATLAVVFEFAGYVDQAFLPFKPMVLVTATLTDAKSKKELFRQRYNYSDQSFQMEDVVFEPAKMYDFRKEEELIAESGRAAEGFRAAIPLIASDIARKLKRQP